MNVKISTSRKEITISEAEVTRFIDLESGIPLSMIKVSCPGSPAKFLAKAFVEETSLSFECYSLKTMVTVSGLSMREDNGVEYIFKENPSKVRCSYKIINFEHKFANEKAILVPEDVRDLPETQANMLRDLPYIRLILIEDIPRGYLLPFPRYPK